MLPRLWHWLDLRFESKAAELSFQRSLQRDLLCSLCLGCLAVVVSMGFRVLSDLRAECGDPEHPCSWSSPDPRTTRIGGVIGLLIWHLLLGGASLACWRRGVLGGLNWEVLALASFLADANAAIILSKPVLANWYGMAPSEAFRSIPPDVDLQVVITVVFCVFAVCSVCPIRWHLLRVLPVLVILPLAVATQKFGLASGEWFSTNAMFWICVCQLCTAWQREANKRRNWNLIKDLQVQETELERRLMIAGRLLSSFCDCTLTLGFDLCITHDCSRLAALLLRSRPIPKGTCICDLVQSKDDAARIRQAVEKSSSWEEEKTIAESLIVEMSDSMGGSVKLHVYLASVQKSAGIEHMVGIAEASEREHGAACNLPDDFMDSTVSGADWTSVSEASGSAVGSQTPSIADAVLGGMDQRSDFGSMSGLDMVAQDRPKKEPACASICMTPALEIRTQNKAFAESFGDSDGQACKSLLMCMEKADEFSQWLAQLQADISAGLFELPTLREFGLVVMQRKPGLSRQTLWLAVAFPEADVRDLAAWTQAIRKGSYLVNIRLTEPTSNRARKALAQHQQEEQRKQSNDGFDPIVAEASDLPGSVV